MSLEISAIMHTPHAQRALEAWDGLPVTSKDAGGLCALLVPPIQKPGLFARLTGNVASAVSGLVARQRFYEHLLTYGDVLPVAPGTEITGSDAEMLLKDNAAALSAALSTFAGQVQYQLTVRWDAARALQRFANSGDQARTKSVTTLAKAAEDTRQSFEANFAAILDKAVLDRISMPADGPETVLNAVLLLHRDSMLELDAALEAIDSKWPEGLHLKLVGPLPPISFALVTLERFGASERRAALELLGLNREAEPGPAEIDAAFRRQARSAHPDNGGEGADMSAMKRARESLKQAASWEPAGENRFLARLRRDDQAVVPVEVAPPTPLREAI